MRDLGHKEQDLQKLVYRAWPERASMNWQCQRVPRPNEKEVA
jgi:hypothetical protein